MKISSRASHISGLILGGALAVGLASCDGVDDDASGSGGASSSGEVDGDSQDSDGPTSGDGDGDTASGGNSGDGDGDTSSGGSASGGRASGGNGAGGDASGGSASGGSGAESNPGVQTLGESCNKAGALACAGENQKLQLLCDADGEWVQNGTCSGTAVCDTGEANRGSCQEPLPECLDREPGEKYCDWQDVMSCGPDRLDKMTVESCGGLCSDGKCASGNACPPEDDTLIDCSEDCTELAEACELDSDYNCGSATILSNDQLPIVARTVSPANSCPDAPVSACDRSAFFIQFEDPDMTYHLELPEGVTALETYLETESGLPVSNGCFDEETVSIRSGCLTIRALHDVFDIYSPFYDIATMIAIVTYSDADGAQNVVVKGGPCPE